MKRIGTALQIAILTGAAAALVAMLFNLQAMEKKQIRDFKSLAKSITDTSMHSIFQGQTENMMQFVALLSQMANITYVGYWIDGKRVLSSGPESLLDQACLVAPKEKEQSIVRGRYLYYSDILPTTGAGLRIVFSLDDFIAKRNNILTAGIIIGLMLIAMTVMIQWINRLLTRLETAEQVKSGMISAITHDANNYLTVIKGKLDNILCKMAHGVPDDHLEKNIAATLENTRSLIYLNNDLSDNERLAEGRMQITLAPVDAVRVLQGVVDGLKETAAERNQTLDLIHESPQALILADEVQLKRVVHNLVHNALKFSESMTTVTARCFVRESMVVIQVEDQGPGIAPQDREKIFHAFVRLDRRVKGTGLGLSIARRLVREMHGTVQVDDAPSGRGAVFSVMFSSRNEVR